MISFLLLTEGIISDTRNSYSIFFKFYWLAMISILFLTEGIISDTRNSYSLFFTFSKFRFNFELFQKKIWPSNLLYFWTSGVRKTSLDKCAKSPFSDYPSTSNMANGPKHCWNLNDSIFAIFIDICEANSIEKRFL